jgi:ribonuclease-3
LSRSEEKTGGRDRFSINTNAFEAVVAAIYLDGGIKPARRFIQNNVLNMLSSLLKDKEYINYKSRLLEKVQAQGHGVPKYTVLQENGPDHNKTFNVGVSISGRRAGAGTGKSKKDAEQLAARAAIENLKQEKSSIDLSDCE